MTTSANNTRSKLVLVLNKPVNVKILKDKPFEGNSAYGTYILYSVEHEGEEKAFFATPEAHDRLSALQLKAGDEVTLRKVAVQNGKKVGSIITVEVISKQVEEKPAIPKPKPAVDAVDNLKTIMEKSLQEAVDITRSVQGVPFQNEDIQKIASCLFIARTKNQSLSFSG